MTKDNNSDDNSSRKMSPEEEKERDEYQLAVIENQRAENEFMRVLGPRWFNTTACSKSTISKERYC
jgi:hypothetical protein